MRGIPGAISKQAAMMIAPAAGPVGVGGRQKRPAAGPINKTVF